MSTAVADVIRARRSINKFKPDTPPLERVRAALELACWAPNHKLTEPWRYFLLGPDTAERVAVLNAEIVSAERGATVANSKLARWRAVPGTLVVTCVVAEDPLRAEEDYAACCCAIQNLQLALWADGIGTKWTTGAVTRDPRFFELLGIARDRYRVVGLIWYGYPDETPAMTRKPLDLALRELP
jgi:nitroreductase